MSWNKLMKTQKISMRNTGQLNHTNRSGRSTLLICVGQLWFQSTGNGNWLGLLSIILGHSVQMLTSESPCLSEWCFPSSLPTRSLGFVDQKKLKVEDFQGGTEIVEMWKGLRKKKPVLLKFSSISSEVAWKLWKLLSGLVKLKGC